MSDSKPAKRYKFTCAHCLTGKVASLPARCPECEKWLTEPVLPKKAK